MHPAGARLHGRRTLLHGAGKQIRKSKLQSLQGCPGPLSAVVAERKLHIGGYLGSQDKHNLIALSLAAPTLGAALSPSIFNTI